MTFKDHMLAERLGFFGLIPFILLATGPWVFYDHTALILQAFVVYSAMILTFMAGTVWGARLGSKEPDPGSLLIPAGVTVAAMASLILPPRAALLVLSAAFLILLQWERRKVFPTLADDGYPRLRRRLTWTAIACHLMAFLNLWMPPAQG